MKIVILDAYASNPGDLSWDGIAAFGELTYYDRTPKDLTVSRIGDAEIVITNKTVISREVLAACPNIRLICLLATGYNVVDIAAARERNIPVCNVPAYSTPSVAQTAMALLLEICMRVGDFTKFCKDGTWTNWADFSYSQASLTELSGKTVGIVGYGQIGRAFGRICRAMGMNILACSRSSRTEIEDDYFSYTDFDTILAESDVISLHCPLLSDTKEMICAESIAKMKDGVILINTARGGLINEQDLTAALKSGKVRAAGLDVVSVEPITADNPLLHAPNCYMTPHVGWTSLEARRRLLLAVENNIRCFLQGKPVNVVN